MPRTVVRQLYIGCVRKGGDSNSRGSRREICWCLEQ